MIDSEWEIRDGIWSTPEDEVNFCSAEEAFVELSIACFVPGRGEDGIRDRGEIGVGAHQSASSAEILWSTLRWRSQTRNEYRHFLGGLCFGGNRLVDNCYRKPMMREEKEKGGRTRL